MDSFSLLSYWRAALAAPPATDPDLIAAEDDDDDDDDDDASFFDLEFSQADADANADAEVEDEASDDESAFGFDLASDASSPPHDLFLKPSSTIVFETDSKPTQFPASLLKSATKLRVLMLAFKKAKPSTAAAASAPSSPKLGKYFIKFKVEEVPIVSLFTRENSAKSKTEVTATADGDEKKLSKDVVLKYLNKIKPLYTRVSRRYLEKLIGERGSSENPPASLVNVDKDSSGVLPTGLRMVRKKLKKSRSASSATAPPPSPPRRRDDSLIEQQDGIQNAIAHCKRSLNKESHSRSQGV